LANLYYHLAIYKFLWHVLADEEIKGKQIGGKYAWRTCVFQMFQCSDRWIW